MRPRSGCVPDGQFRPAALTPLVLKLLVAALAIYACIVGAAWATQERLLFFPRPAIGPRTPPPGWTLEVIRFGVVDGTELAGVLVMPPGPPAPLLISFGGNAEEVTESAAHAEHDWGTRAVLLVNYRGYGASQGQPGEKSMVADALALHDWAIRREDVRGDRVALHGRSLGSAVATQVAAARKPRCVVLTTPLASAVDVAREAYRWLPVALLMRHRFDAASAAPCVTAPALVAIAAADTLVRPAHSERLARAWGGPVELLRIPARGHNDIQDDPAYGSAVRAFLDRHH